MKIKLLFFKETKMIKLKNLWKVVLALMVMSAMLVACDTGSSDSDSDSGNKTENNGGNTGDNGGNTGDNGGNTGDNGFAKMYVAGLFNAWAGNTDADAATEMKTTDGKVYTLEFETIEGDTAATVNPYGFKFCTEKGWMEQYVNATAGAENVTNQFDFDVEYDVMYATKTQLEEKDEDGVGKYNDNSTKFFFMYDLVANETYTITLNIETKKVKISGKKGAILKNYTVAEVNSVMGSVTGTDWPTIDLAADGSFEFTYDAATMTEIRFIYRVKEGETYNKYYKVQGSECTALDTEVAIKDDEGLDDYCKFDTSLFTDGATYVVTLNKEKSTCTVSAK